MKTRPILTIAGTAICAVFLLTSCGPAQQSDETQDTGEESAAITSPKHLMYVVHEVADFDVFKKVFDEHEPMRKQNGLSLIAVMRDMENKNRIHIALSAENLVKAHEFAGSEDLKNAMQKAGVVGAPSIYFLNAEYANLVQSDNPNRIIVLHKVKDYSAWKAVFDGHKAKREEHGLTDRLVARADDDPNSVALSFLVADVNKAKEFMASEDLKSTMTQAGVEGPPTIYFTSVVK